MRPSGIPTRKAIQTYGLTHTGQRAIDIQRTYTCKEGYHINQPECMHMICTYDIPRAGARAYLLCAQAIKIHNHVGMPCMHAHMYACMYVAFFLKDWNVYGKRRTTPRVQPPDKTPQPEGRRQDPAPHQAPPGQPQGEAPPHPLAAPQPAPPESNRLQRPPPPSTSQRRVPFRKPGPARPPGPPPSPTGQGPFPRHSRQ